MSTVTSPADSSTKMPPVVKLPNGEFEIDGIDSQELLGGAIVDAPAEPLGQTSADELILTDKQKRIRQGLDGPITSWIVILHLGALAAPFTFTWEGLAAFFFFSWLTGSIGICLGFHRMLTHRSFKTSRPMKILLATIGGLAGEGSAVHWVANHRKHHAFSDLEGDPHTPNDGGWWSHVFWTLWARDAKNYEDYNRRWAPDLADDPALLFLDRTFIFWHIGLGAILGAVGYAFGGATLGLSLVVWGMFLRLAFVLNSTWLVNSATHIWGYRTYETKDDSRNNWWVALLTYGEGWHNNHHAYPSMARAGHKWWEIDITFWALKVMKFTGLVWDVVDGQHLGENKKKMQEG